MMRPVMEHLCKYESLVDGTLSMNDLARMHEAIDVREENTYRAQQQQAKGAK